MIPYLSSFVCYCFLRVSMIQWKTLQIKIYCSGPAVISFLLLIYAQSKNGRLYLCCDALTKRDILSEHYWQLFPLLWPIRTRHGGNTWPYNQRMGPASRTMKYIHEVHLSWLVILQSSLKWSWYHFSVLRYHVQIFKSFRDIQSFTAIIFAGFLPSINLISELYALLFRSPSYLYYDERISLCCLFCFRVLARNQCCGEAKKYN